MSIRVRAEHHPGSRAVSTPAVTRRSEKDAFGSVDWEFFHLAVSTYVARLKCTKRGEVVKVKSCRRRQMMRELSKCCH